MLGLNLLAWLTALMPTPPTQKQSLPGRCSSLPSVKSGNIHCWEKRPAIAAKLLSKDEARRIAANIAKLPDLLRKA